MVMAINGYLQAAVQEAWGTVNAVPSVAIPFIASNMDERISNTDIKDSGNRYQQGAIGGHVAPSYKGQVHSRVSGGIGTILFGFFGDDAFTDNGDGTASHKLVPQDVTPYLTLWQMYNTYTVKQKRCMDASIEQVSFEYADKELSLSIEALASQPEIVDCPATATPSTRMPLSVIALITTIDGVNLPNYGGKITFKNNRNDEDFPSGGIFRQSAELGVFQLEWELEFAFSDLSWVKKFWGGADHNTPDGTIYEFPVLLTFEGGVIGSGANKETIQIYIPKSVWKDDGVDTPLAAQKQIRQKLSGKATVPTAGDRPYVTILNTDLAEYVIPTPP